MHICNLGQKYTKQTPSELFAWILYIAYNIPFVTLKLFYIRFILSHYHALYDIITQIYLRFCVIYDIIYNFIYYTLIIIFFSFNMPSFILWLSYYQSTYLPSLLNFFKSLFHFSFFTDMYSSLYFNIRTVYSPHTYHSLLFN